VRAGSLGVWLDALALSAGQRRRVEALLWELAH
jgi:hypothetical protein